MAQDNWKPIAGQHYRALNIAPPLQSGITFYFWPGSASSYQLEHALQNWQKLNPNMEIQRIPLVTRPHWRLLAKAWLVAEAIDKTNSLAFLNDLYKTIHQDSQPISNIEELKQFFVSHDTDPLNFVTQFNSLAINQQLKSQQTAAALFPIIGVPTIIINNQWYSDASMVKTSAQLIDVINLLLSENSQINDDISEKPAQ